MPGRALVDRDSRQLLAWPTSQTQNLGCSGVLEPGGGVQSMDHISPLITLEQVQ